MVHFSICACHLCAGAVLSFFPSSQFLEDDPRKEGFFLNTTEARIQMRFVGAHFRCIMHCSGCMELARATQGQSRLHTRPWRIWSRSQWLTSTSSRPLLATLPWSGDPEDEGGPVVGQEAEDPDSEGTRPPQDLSELLVYTSVQAAIGDRILVERGRRPRVPTALALSTNTTTTTMRSRRARSPRRPRSPRRLATTIKKTTTTTNAGTTSLPRPTGPAPSAPSAPGEPARRRRPFRWPADADD